MVKERVDIAIIGGGIAGASLAYFLEGRRDVIVLEREDALGYHATGRSAAEFSLRFHGPVAGALTAASYPFFREPPDGFAEIALLRERGNLLIANAAKSAHAEAVFASEQASSSSGEPVLQWLSSEEALIRVPFLDPAYVKAAFYDPACWDIEVESLLQSYVKGAKRAGAQFRMACALERAEFRDARWHLTTTAGEIEAAIVVNAGGAWADHIAGTLGLDPLGLVPHRRTAITVDVPEHGVADLPELNEIDEAFYIKPDAGRLLVSPADETPVDPHDAWAEEIDIAYAAHYLTECTTLTVERIASSWAGLRTFAADRTPVVGFSSHAPGVFWLAGQGGYGIQTSPALGSLAAALVLSEPRPDLLNVAALDVSELSPARLGG